MSVERAFEGWEEVQRQGQDIVDRFSALAQGLGCMLQSHVRFMGLSPLHSSEPGLDRQWYDETISSWPWMLKPSQRVKSRVNRVQFNGIPRTHTVVSHKPYDDDDGAAGIQELGNRLGEVGAAVGACVGNFMHNAMNQFSWPFQADSVSEAFSDLLHPRPPISMEYQDWRALDEQQDREGVLMCRDFNSSVALAAEEEELEEVSDLEEEFEEATDTPVAAREQFHAVLSKSDRQLHRQQSTISVSTTFNSRTQEVESSVIARGDLWRAEASHGGNTASGGSSPVFLLQVGPILLVRDSTLLLPIHLSKQHLLWYGFDRKNGVHSLCPAIWSKQRRWLLMSMICLNPFTCSFLDFQFPNGQCTYIAGEGFSSGAFLNAFGGLIQAQGRYPGDLKVSFSKKVGWGTRITPVVQLPERSFSLDVVQQLAWQRSGALVRPMVELSLTPTFGGRNSGWRAEVVHFPKEKLSVAGGVALTIQPTAFASIAVGRSKRNGSHSGNSGFELLVETPLDNINRTSFTVKLNSGVDF